MRVTNNKNNNNSTRKKRSNGGIEMAKTINRKQRCSQRTSLVQAQVAAAQYICKGPDSKPHT